MGRIGAASVEEAEQRFDERRALQSRLAAAAAQLKALAPDGVERLERMHAELAPRSAADASEEALAELDARALDLMEAFAAAESQLEDAARAHAEAREALVQMRTRAEERRQRIEALTASLGDGATRTTTRAKAMATAAAAEAARNAAVRDQAAWRETAPGEEQLAQLQAAAAAAEGQRARADGELIELRRTEAGIEGELKSDRADDVELRVAELEEACAGAAALVEALEREIAALQLLARELDLAERETRERFAKPVMDRVGPFLQLVFPQARPRFGDGFALQALERTNGTEDLQSLSEGTQEQLAVLARLGLGRLLADAGTPAPLILDDAMVYSDDARIEHMFEALKLAAQSHQVLVLTCRERTFAGLGGHRIAIGAWRPD